MRSTLAIVAAGFVLAACGKDAEPPPAAPSVASSVFDPSTATATIHGQVLFRGESPARRRVAIAGDEACVERHRPEGPLDEDRVVVNEDGTLWNAIVFLDDPGLADLRFPDAMTPPLLLEMEGCLYRPQTLAIRIDQELHVENRDPTTHHPHWFAEDAY